MDFTPESREQTKKRLERIAEVYGFVPVVNQVLSERPDYFLPTSELSGNIFEHKTVFDTKTKHLMALCAAAAIGGEHCMRNQMKDAVNCGATEDEVLEVLEIAAYMSMTRSQSYSFRVFADQFGKKLE